MKLVPTKMPISNKVSNPARSFILAGDDPLHIFYRRNVMKLSKMQITGFGYLKNATIIENKSLIAINLKGHENAKEDVWLHCTACSEISDFIKDKLLIDLRQGHTVLIKFCASYDGFAEAFNALDNSNKRLVIFNAKLEAIKAVFVNGSLRSFDLKQDIAV